MRPVRIAIFASGTGSNAMALVAKAQELSKEKIEIAFILSDKPAAPVLEKAKNAGVRTYLVEKKADRKAHEAEVLSLLHEYHVDWIFLAGYMRLLSADFIQHFRQWHEGAEQIVNIHPSLLPAYPGVDSIARAFSDSVKESGVTLHLVDEGMDTGRILVQEIVCRSQDSTLPAWTQQFHEVEHRLYSQFLENVALGRQPTVYFKETP
ncbi:phosphoribosylglycinamide formyltransferase [Bdellovibrio bacteriovorus]|uniref:Phosphoribosylglycinamide formyltransferase n=1 Tax=Bdellovibrio bacteriovorus TaxID=959 RepID=A0A150WGQ5_BDEBC|nr:phosphoribosylglycinamide formyltransferase [Bdellovibrio bacteriovorus]KYG62001.1 phosphoribosylglycinamide formyltransferase [Bdellovibrio bacteriovorus]